MSQPADRPGRIPRIGEIDALRGFAMLGIVFINILQMTGMPRETGPAADDSAANLGAFVYEVTTYQRFFPIFTVLFGLGFAIFLRNAATRTDRPRVVLARRLVVLGVIGVLHSLLQHDEVLRWYAVGGVIIMLPASYLPRRWVLAAAWVLFVPGFVLNGVFLIPTLLLFGMALAQYEVPETLGRRGRQLATFFAVTLALSLLMGVYQYVGGVGPEHRGRSLPAGVVFAAMYAAGFLLLLRTPAGRVLRAVFAPVGKLALTNYLLATVLILAGEAVLDLGAEADYGAAALLGLAIGAVQVIISPIWLRFFRFGPFEWAWRCLTWWNVLPIRRDRSAQPVA